MGRAEVPVQLQTMLHSLLLWAELGLEHGPESELLKLIMPPKYAELAPSLCKKKGRPTAKRIELLKAQQAMRVFLSTRRSRWYVNVTS
jgi:hypothetical protein